jgi:hypothetical protein
MAWSTSASPRVTTYAFRTEKGALLIRWCRGLAAGGHGRLPVVDTSAALREPRVRSWKTERSWCACRCCRACSASAGSGAAWMWRRVSPGRHDVSAQSRTGRAQPGRFLDTARARGSPSGW